MQMKSELYVILCRKKENRQVFGQPPSLATTVSGIPPKRRRFVPSSHVSSEQTEPLANSFHCPDTNDNVVLMCKKMRNFPICETCTEVQRLEVLHHIHCGAADCSSDIRPLKSLTKITTFFSCFIFFLVNV